MQYIHPAWQDDALRRAALTAFGYAYTNFGNGLNNHCPLLPTCTHEDSPFHPRSMRPQLFSIIALTWYGIVSVPACAVRMSCKATAQALARCPSQAFVCLEGGETFLRSKDPAAVLPLSDTDSIFN